ncbi:hypothetical protein [Sinomonas mesophila]|uniref:hypothetical protein n=1 Tax=Sinomonas mesophila TaxID=1531955 RepID=UPI00098604DD|nr:hypothetical protein [Sinomonas mesophila]
MRTPAPLPEGLGEGPFTSAEARLAGLTPTRLRAGDLERLSHGLYTPAHDDVPVLALARAVCAASPGAWVSHESAAALHGLPVPPWMDLDAALHVSRPRALPQSRRMGLIAHNVTAFAEELTEISGVPVATPGRTWLDLARRLPLPDLVALGDHLIRRPRPELEGRSAPLDTVAGLRLLVGRHPNLQGIRKARAALELMRVGADSVPETKLRLAIVDAGLPEPELQIALRPDDPWSPTADAGYRSVRVGLQYEGEHHLTAEQQWRDVERDAQFTDADWLLIKATRKDLANGFDRTVRRLRDALVGRGALPQPGVVRLKPNAASQHAEKEIS